MKAFLIHLKIQLLMDIRNRGTLLTFYLIPMVFYMVMGSVFSSIMPAARQTLGASMSIFAVTMGAVLGLPPTLVHMRESGTLRAYRVSGIPGWSVLLTKAASAFINLLVVFIIITFTAPVLFKAEIPGSWASYLLTMVLIIMASIVLGLLVGVVARSQSMATLLSQAIFLPSLLLGGIMFPAEMLPETFQWLGRLFPATHAMQSFLAGSFGMTASLPLFLSNAAIAGIGLIAMLLTLWRFRAISVSA